MKCLFCWNYCSNFSLQILHTKHYNFRELLQLEISDICILGNPFGNICALHRQLWLENLMVFFRNYPTWNSSCRVFLCEPWLCFVLRNKRVLTLNLTCSPMGSLCRWMMLLMWFSNILAWTSGRLLPSYRSSHLQNLFSDLKEMHL